MPVRCGRRSDVSGLAAGVCRALPGGGVVGGGVRYGGRGGVAGGGAVRCGGLANVKRECGPGHANALIPPAVMPPPPRPRPAASPMLAPVGSDVLERPYAAGGARGTPPLPPPPLPMFEADCENFASAPSVPRGFNIENVRPAFGGDHRGTLGGGWASQPHPPL